MANGKVVVYDAFNHPPKGPSEVRCTQAEKRTVECGDEADLNIMLRRMGPGGALPVFGGKEPFYGDVSEVGDYRHALEIVEAADEAFMSQPADIRNKFENDAAKFVDFVTKGENRAEAERLGLIAPAEKPAGTPAAPAEVRP